MNLTIYNRKAKAYRFNRTVSIYLKKLGFEKPDDGSNQYCNRDMGVYVYADAKNNYTLQSRGVCLNTTYYNPADINGLLATEFTKELNFLVQLNEYLALAKKEASCSKKKR